MRTHQGTAAEFAKRGFGAWLELWWEYSPTALRIGLTAAVGATYWSTTGPGVLAPIVLIAAIWVCGR